MSGVRDHMFASSNGWIRPDHSPRPEVADIKEAQVFNADISRPFFQCLVGDCSGESLTGTVNGVCGLTSLP